MPMKFLYSILSSALMIPAMAFADEEPLMEAVAETGCTLNGQPVPCSEMFSAVAPYLAMIILIAIILAVIGIISWWRIFTKAGKPGWAALIPIYNIIVMLEIVKRPIWWVVLFLVPFVNVVVEIIVIHRLSRSFGKGVGYTLGMIFLGIIFFPMLAFGKSEYEPLED